MKVVRFAARLGVLFLLAGTTACASASRPDPGPSVAECIETLVSTGDHRCGLVGVTTMVCSSAPICAVCSLRGRAHEDLRRVARDAPVDLVPALVDGRRVGRRSVRSLVADRLLWEHGDLWSFLDHWDTIRIDAGDEGAPVDPMVQAKWDRFVARWRCQCASSIAAEPPSRSTFHP